LTTIVNANGKVFRVHKTVMVTIVTVKRRVKWGKSYKKQKKMREKKSQL